MTPKSVDLDVVGIGSMVVDRVHRTRRLVGLDEKGILRDIEGRGPVARAVGGVVLNHLGWAAVLGLRTGIFGRQGEDEDGRMLRAAMDALGIERHLVLGGAPTSIAEIFVDDDGGRSIYMAPGATSETDAAHVREHHANFIRRARRLTTEVSQLPLDAGLEALRIAAEAGVPSVVDFDVPPSDALATLGDEATLDAVLRAANLLKPSKTAVAELVDASSGERADSLGLARAVAARYGNEAVIVTDGEAGCAIVSGDFACRVPAQRVKAVDTTGAGDAFLGGMLAALALGFEWEAVGRLANACGAACTEQLGAFPEDEDRARARVFELAKQAGIELDAPKRRAPAAAPATKQDSGEGADAALRVLGVGADEIARLGERHDGTAFVAAAALIEEASASGGRVHVTGVGKPEHVARYAASLLSSTGTPASFLHATEALHGSLGQLVRGDVVVAISNSGGTHELRACVSAAKSRGCALIAVTGVTDSWLAEQAAVVLDAGVADEGGPLGLAPRASVAAEVIVCGALAAALQQRSGFTHSDYAERHPAGALGEKARHKD